MKKAAILLIAVMLIPLFGFTQTIENVDYISPFNDGVAALKKGNEWAFINKQGTIVIDFRNDLVITKTENTSYPIFKNSRCLIVNKKEGISYFGFIDKKGKTVIEPQFLNAIDFNNNVAIVLELVKEEVGNNDILGKAQVSYDYFEVVINAQGEILYYLTQEPKHITLSKEFIRQPPKITSKLISDKVFAIWSKDKKWEIKKLEK